MNKEQQEVLDDGYNRYRATIIKEFYEDTKELRKWATVEGPGGHTKEEFINKCKTDTEFSEKWGLNIEERELRLEERCELGYKYVDAFEWDMLMGGGREGDEGNCNDYKIPTKLITITYNDTKLESYE